MKFSPRLILDQTCSSDHFDPVGYCLNMVDETGLQTAYQYNNVDWLTSVQYPDGQKVSYSFNGAGDRLTETIETPSTSGRGAGVRATDTRVIAYGYDTGGRLISRASDTFVFDPDGNQITATENGEETRYVWSSDNRLLRVEKDLECQKHNKKKCGKCPQVLNFTLAEDYGYVPESWRRLTRTISAPEGRGLGHGTGHDCDEIPGDGWGHHKDGRESATFFSAYQNQDESHEYLLKTDRENDDRDDKDGKKKKCPEKDDKDSRLKLVRSFIGGPGTDDLKMTKYHGRNLWHLKDMLGSTIGLTNRAGHPIAKIGYDVFGNLRFPDRPGHGVPPCKNEDIDGILDRFDSGRSMGFDHDSERFGRHFGKQLTPYLYTGRRWSSFTNLYFNRNRYYQPKVGRFTSRDPIRFGGGNNLWKYGRNNPMKFVDPKGLFSLLIIDDSNPDTRLLGKDTQWDLLFRDEMPWTIWTSSMRSADDIDEYLIGASALGSLRYFIVISHGVISEEDIGVLGFGNRPGLWAVSCSRRFFFEPNGEAIFHACYSGEPMGVAQTFSIQNSVKSTGALGIAVTTNGRIEDPNYGKFVLDFLYDVVIDRGIGPIQGDRFERADRNTTIWPSIFDWARKGNAKQTYDREGRPIRY